MTNVQYDNITAYKIMDIGKVNCSHTIRINCKEEVDSIVMCSVDSNIFGYECINGQVTYSGKNNVKLVYRDSSGMIISNNSNADYSDTIVAQYITPSTKMSFDIVVLDAKTDIGGNIVTIQLMLEVSGSAYVADSCPVLTESEGLFAHYNHVELVTDIDSMHISGDLSAQLTATNDIARVIMADASVSCTDYVLLDGVLTVSGDMVVGLMYMSGDSVAYDQLTSPYRTEIECPMTNGQLTVLPSVKNVRIRLDILEGQLNNIFTADIAVSYAVTSITCIPTALVDDCYTRNSTLELERSHISSTLPCGAVSTRAVVEQNLSGADMKDVVAFANVVSTVTNCRYLEGQVVVEGIISGTVIYNSQEGIASTVIELPFAQSVDIEYVGANCIGSAKATVLSSRCSVVGDSLVVRAELCIDIVSSRTATYSVISGVSETPLEQNTRCGIEVCMAKTGETLWQLAKALHMEEQEILSINPDIVSPLEKDTKIVIYNRL